MSEPNSQNPINNQSEIEERFFRSASVVGFAFDFETGKIQYQTAKYLKVPPKRDNRSDTIVEEFEIEGYWGESATDEWTKIKAALFAGEKNVQSVVRISQGENELVKTRAKFVLEEPQKDKSQLVFVTFEQVGENF